MLPSPGIYAIQVNRPDGTVGFYVGKASNVRKRIACHKSTLRHGKHINAHLQRLWDLYGESAFEFQQVFKCAVESLSRWESVVDAGFRKQGISLNLNVPESGEAPKTLSVETRAKIGAGRKGKVQSAESRARIGAAHKGKTMSPEARQKIGEASKFRIRSPESYLKMVATKKAQEQARQEARRLSGN